MKEHFGDFNVKILEIGAGTGFLAKNILKLNEDVQYSILDIEKITRIPILEVLTYLAYSQDYNNKKRNNYENF